MMNWLTDFLQSGWMVPIKIILTLIAAGIVRFIAHRVINKMVRSLVTRSPQRRTPPSKATSKAVAMVTRSATPFNDQRRDQRIGALGSLGRSAVTIILLIIVVLMILSDLGFNIAALLAGTSIAGIAIAFGVQTILRDIISGVFLLIEDQFGMGDTVTIADVTGVVEEIQLRITQLRDESGTVWYFRNGDIGKVANYSQSSASESDPQQNRTPGAELPPEPDASGPS